MTKIEKWVDEFETGMIYSVLLKILSYVVIGLFAAFFYFLFTKGYPCGN